MRTSRKVWLLVAVVALATVSLIWAGVTWRARAASAQIRSVAVLPFSGNAAFSGEIIDCLTRIQGLQVLGRTSALQAGIDPSRQLEAAAILAGSITRQDDRLHIAVAMHRTSDGYRLWSTTFDRPAGAMHRAVEDIARAIAYRLQMRLPAASHLPEPSAPGYAAYLEGRHRFDQGTPDALNEAQQKLQRATELDPHFVPAWAWLSIVREYRVAAGMARPNQAMPASREAAERAVALDPDSGIAHLALGIVKLQYDWDWAGAKEELDRALAALPESSFAIEWHARWLQSQRRWNEALAETKRALVLDPLSAAIAGDAAAQYIALGQPDRAVPFAQKAADLAPGDPKARAALANVLWLAGEKDKSRQMMEQLRSSGAASRLPAAQLATLEARLGEPQDARQLLDAAEDLPDDQLLPAVEYAGLAGVLEDWDRLFSWTEEAYGERDVELPYWPGSPVVPKSDPRFDAFLAQMNLQPPEGQ